MSEISYASLDSSWGQPLNRRYSGDSEVLAGDIKPGDVVKFIHEHDYENNAKYHENHVVVLDIRDEWLDVLHLDGLKGWIQTESLADNGLQPYVGDSLTFWNPVNHTQSTGVRVSTNPMTKRSAERIDEIMTGISELQAVSGVAPTEPSIETVVLDALVDNVLREKTFQYFQQDIDSK